MDIPEKWHRAAQREGFLDVDAGHRVWWTEFGAASATPILVVHGGPGSGSNLRTLELFDPALHRVVFIDQRGSGRSEPPAGLCENRTCRLVSDFETLRKSIGIERWTVFGGSWGASLALTYGQWCPMSCSSLVLRGLPFLHEDYTRWVFFDRPTRLPEQWASFVELAGDDGSPAEVITRLYDAVCSSDETLRRRATQAVVVLEYGLHGSSPEPLRDAAQLVVSQTDMQRAAIFLHYWANQWFLPSDSILFDVPALRDTPVTLVHGAKDWICPAEGSKRVKSALPHAVLHIVREGGHSPFDPSMAKVLQEAVRSPRLSRDTL